MRRRETVYFSGNSKGEKNMRRWETVYFSGNSKGEKNMRKNWAALALTGMLCLTTFAGTQTVSAETADSAKQVDIVFTHDTHSHLNTFTTVVDDPGAESEKS